MDMSRPRAMDYLGISSTMLARLENERKIKHVRIPAGSRVTIRHKQEWLDEFIEKHTVDKVAV